MKWFNGGQGIASVPPNSLILLPLEAFAIALSIYFSIFGRELESSDYDNTPFSLGFLPEFDNQFFAIMTENLNSMSAGALELVEQATEKLMFGRL